MFQKHILLISVSFMSICFGFANNNCFNKIDIKSKKKIDNTSCDFIDDDIYMIKTISFGNGKKGKMFFIKNENIDGYLTSDYDNNIIDQNFKCNIDKKLLNSDDIFYKNKSYFSDGEIIISKNISVTGESSVSDDFYYHADQEFVDKKDRFLNYELDSNYSTKTTINSDTVFKNKIIWSTYQTGGDCGPLALANLLWTYKVNNIIDLTKNCKDSQALADLIQPFVNYNKVMSGVTFRDMLLGKEFFGDTGYYIDYCDVTNGISDTLKNAPLIGMYCDYGTGHYALVSGKGRSLYKKILGISYYTSWDITNTWKKARQCDNYWYMKQKYWVDNKYIVSGYVLRDKNKNVVPLL